MAPAECRSAWELPLQAWSLASPSLVPVMSMTDTCAMQWIVTCTAICIVTSVDTAIQ